MTAAERQRRCRARKRRGALFSSKKTDWATPQDFFDNLDREFHFELDACATAENAKCSRFYTMADNGLVQPWTSTCWCNPPYGRQIGLWLAKARDSALAGATVVALIPSRTCTRLWHEIVAKASEIRFVPGRLTFEGAEHPAPFGSAVVIWRA